MCWQKKLQIGDFVEYNSTYKRVSANLFDQAALRLEGFGYVEYEKVQRLIGFNYYVNLDKLSKEGYKLFSILVFSPEHENIVDYNDVLHYFEVHGVQLPPPEKS